MSKIGKKSIIIPEGVTVAINDSVIAVKGPKGELTLVLHPKVEVAIVDKTIAVSVKKPEDRRQKAMWGTFRSLLANMVTGVTTGYAKRLEVIGVGYKAAVAAGKLVLNLGYSHPVEMIIPKGLEVKVEKNVITVFGANKQEVGEFAALARSNRIPEPYKGKGIKYDNEVVRRKAGKVVKAVGS